MSDFFECEIEEAAPACLQNLSYAVQSGLAIAPGELEAEPSDYNQVVLERRLRDALARLNPELPAETRCYPGSSPATCGPRTASGLSGELHE